MMRRWILLVSLLLGAAPRLEAVPWSNMHRPRLIDPTTFDRLLREVRAEPFADGKLERVRVVAGGRVYLFTSGQAIALFDAFAFWDDRLQALRLLPLVDASNAAAVCRYFEPAPPTVRAEAARVLGLAP
jgi:hypothetical protein